MLLRATTTWLLPIDIAVVFTDRFIIFETFSGTFRFIFHHKSIYGQTTQ